MIDKLNLLENFASFKQVKDLNFKKVNLFYGYNGSGKTSFTRFLSCLNNDTLDNDFSSARWSINVNNNTHTRFPCVYKDKIKVFNIDFIDNELQFKEGKAKKISAIIGQENIQLNEEIRNLTQQRDALLNNRKELKSKEEKDKAESKLEDKKTEIAKLIREALHIENANSYNKKQVGLGLDNFNSDKNISMEEKNDAVKLFISNNTTEISPEIIQNFKKLIIDYTNIDKIITILKTPIKRKNVDIKDNILKWMEEGINIHKSEHSHCQFCNQEIMEDYWNSRYAEIQQLLQKDEDYEKAEKEFNEEKNKILEYINIVDKFACNIGQRDFIDSTFLNEYNNFKNRLDEILIKIHPILDNLKDIIYKKDLAKGEIYQFEYNLQDDLHNIEHIVENICITITSNNAKVQNIQKEKLEARQTVINYFLQDNIEEINNLKENIASATNKYNEDNQKLSDLQREITTKSARLENQEDIINKINEQLGNFLDINLSFQYDTIQKNYMLMRKSIDGMEIPAKHLSEGEKNFIAFLYFIISLDSSTKTEKKNEIIVIDDPVSSLDSNKLFHIGSLLLDNVVKYGQIFFFTHNFYFFTKVRDALKNKYKKDTESSTKKYEDIKIYEIKYHKTDGSQIVEASKFIQKHISEYMDIIEKLKELYNRNDNEKDASTANLIRRVLEIFISFKCPREDCLYGKFKALIKDENRSKYNYLWSIANAFSHTEENSSSIPSLNISYVAGKEEINDLFHFMQDIDDKHFKDLKITFQNM